MSAAPDSSDLAPSRDPAAYGKRPLFSTGFLVWVALCVICALGGVAVGRFGLPGQAAKLAPAVALVPAPPPGTPAAAPAVAIPTPTPPLAVPPPTVAPAAATLDELGLDDRVARLESAADRADSAAAAALAAASLSVAAEGSAPFDLDLAAYARLAPADPDLQALAPLAAQGAASREALAAAFPDLAAKAALAARAPGDAASLGDRIWAALAQVVIVRRIDPAAPGVDGALTRAQDEAAAGDLAAAVQTLQALPPNARGPLADWLAAARRRIEIDRRIAAVRARALAALTAATAPAAPAEAAPL